MTMPRAILRGATVMVTRRTIHRTHLLRPDAAINQLFKYCLGLAAQRHGMLIHAAVLMSTHEHLVLTDVEGRLPHFMRELHRLVALGVKTLRKWEGSVWDQKKASVVVLHTENAILEKIAYVMANPVEAGLVRKADHWPGVTTAPGEIGATSWTVARPSFFFAPNNDAWPASVTLELSIPPSVAMNKTDLQTSLTEQLGRLVTAALARRPILKHYDPRKLCKISPYTRAKSEEPRQQLNPTLAVGKSAGPALKEAIKKLREFRTSYRIALDQWRKGVRDALFPPGTWLMRELHGVRVAP